MCAQDVQFFYVADDGPVDGDRCGEYAVFDVTAQLSEQVQALGDSGWVAGGIEVDVRAVAFSQSRTTVSASPAPILMVISAPHSAARSSFAGT